MNILIITALAIVMMAWGVYERDNRKQGYHQYEWEPYELEDRDN
ncbi:hypothetical protein [Segatella buccae]|nr:hypothetical protein [Segatella buccae]